jgi:hypothetical protein
VFVTAPYDIESLRNNKRFELRLADVVRDIVPDIEYSTYAHGILEFLNRLDGVKDIASVYEALTETNSYIHNEYTPSNRLLYEQASIIREADFPGMFSAIDSKPEDIQRPTILTFDSTEYDPFLDDKASSEQICKAAKAVLLRCMKQTVAGAVHARPDLSIDSYTQVLSTIKPYTDFTIALNRIEAEPKQVVFEAIDGIFGNDTIEP